MLATRQRRTLTRLRLSSQLVSDRAGDILNPADVVRWMTAIQAQDFLAAKWAVGVRLPGAMEAGIDAAIANRSIVRSWPLRGTLHLVAPEDLGWMLKLSEERMLARTASIFAAEGLTPRILEAARDASRNALSGDSAHSGENAQSGKNALTRDEMSQIFDGVGINSHGQARYHTLWYLSQTGTLCLGATRGKQQTFVLLDEWVPNPRRLDREEGLGELARRYFLSHGPATLRDFAWWAQLTMKDAKIGLAIAMASLTKLELDDREYYLSPAVSGAPPDSDSTRLLPSFDEQLLGYQDRSAPLANEHARFVIPAKNGLFLPTIVHDGLVVGTWKRTIVRDQVTVVPKWFAAPSRATEIGFVRQAKHYAAFLGAQLRQSV